MTRARERAAGRGWETQRPRLKPKLGICQSAGLPSGHEATPDLARVVPGSTIAAISTAAVGGCGWGHDAALGAGGEPKEAMQSDDSVPPLDSALLPFRTAGQQ